MGGCLGCPSGDALALYALGDSYPGDRRCDRIMQGMEGGAPVQSIPYHHLQSESSINNN